jgi:hypothetical protein
MNFIKPSEISARILSLLDESDEKVIIVSPYMKISKWYKFSNKIESLKTRRIYTEIYVRDDPENTATYRDLENLALEYHKIPNLHCKLYMNEKYGIVTSMNLLLSSEINSLEIGYATESRSEYTDLLNFFHRYIQIGEPLQFKTIAGRPIADLKVIMHNIRKELKGRSKNTWIWLALDGFHLSTGENNYIFSIKDGYLRIAAFLRISSRTEQNAIQRLKLIAKKVEDITAVNIEMSLGTESRIRTKSQSGILQLSGKSKKAIGSTCMNGILIDEAEFIIETVTRFVETTDDLLFQHRFNNS